MGEETVKTLAYLLKEMKETYHMTDDEYLQKTAPWLTAEERAEMIKEVNEEAK